MKSLVSAAAALGVLAVAAGPAFAWGALAVDQDGDRYGWSAEYDNEDAARRRALNECGPTCRWSMTFRNICASYARDAESGTWGWSEGVTRAAAERNAIAQCRGAGGSSCRIIVWACDR
jgi:hypothetical protein